MVLNGVKENVSSNLGESESFKIEANEAAFQILTDKLYKYKIRAIVRELAANAIDANRVSKKPLNNWEITLPNSINPMFSIEDFGVGMSEKEIKEVYTTFFKSTKSSSNDQTGMFGLGSKTPFAYTKQFIVESSKDGFKNIYSMHSENGKPEVIKVNPQPIPTDKTGTKVSFSVKNSDFREFYEAMIYSSAVWPGLPKINGSSEFYSYLSNKMWKTEIPAEKILENTNKVYSSMEKVPTSEDFVTIGNDKFYLEMGNVLYYVSTENLKIDYDLLNLAGKYIIHAPIGSVSITPNREDLQYDNKTIEFLNKEILSVIVKNYEFGFKSYNDKTFNKIMNLDEKLITPEARKSLKKLIKEYKSLAKTINIIDKSFVNNEIFAISAFTLRNSSKCLTSAWRPLSGYFNCSNEPGYNFLVHLNSWDSVPKVKIIELKDGEFKRYKVTDGALTGFFNSRINRLNRDLFAKHNGRDVSDTIGLTRYGNDAIITPIYIFCKEGNSDSVKGLYPLFKDAEVIKDFSKIPSSFDYNKVTMEKEKEEIENKKCLQVFDGGKESIESLASLKQEYSGRKIILMMKPNRDYELMDFQKYFTSKVSIDSMEKRKIDKYYLDRIISVYNANFNDKYIVLVGKPSDLKKMKIYDCKELSFEMVKTQSDVASFKTKLADKLAEKSLVDLEKLPTKVQSQSIISDTFLNKAEHILESDSEFLSEIKEIKKNCLTIQELEKRSELISKARMFKDYNSDSIRNRIAIYSDSVAENMNKVLKQKIESFPLGKTFFREYWRDYYSGGQWETSTPFDEFFNIVKMSENI